MPQNSPIARTGLVCLFCREPVAYVAQTSPRGLHIYCPSCTHRWVAEDLGATDHDSITRIRDGDGRPHDR